MRDGSVMVDSDLVDFLSGSMDSAINFSGSADFHTPIHPPLVVYGKGFYRAVNGAFGLWSRLKAKFHRNPFRILLTSSSY